jgi:hypothetical protein
MARTIRAGKQKHKAKPKSARRRAIAARVEAPVSKRRAVGGALSEKEHGGGAEVARGHTQHDTQRSNNHDARETVTRASESEQRQQIRHPPNRTDVYGHSMGTAMQATQWLLALPFLALQMWEAALLRPFKR